jgi:molecular chaperone GrpE
MANKRKSAQVKKVLEDFLEENDLEANSMGDPKMTQEAEEKISSLEAEVKDLKDKLSRQMADMANMRRRQAEDMQRTRENSVMQFASEMLPILDSFRMSLQSEGSKEDLQQGVDMIVGMMTDLLSRHGVEEVTAEGEIFDPRFHEAIAVLEQADSEPGTILQVQMPGYRIGDRILRPSRVIVSKIQEDPAEDRVETEDA